MNTQMKTSLALIATVVLVLAGMLGISAVTDSSEEGLVTETPAGTAGGSSTVVAEDPRLVRADSHILGEPGTSGVEFVEFLDFECEGCRAAYPAVEELRQMYDERVTFVARYFPLPNHFNSRRAARAVEAAAQQGKYEQMYSKMFETQAEWGEKQEPMDDLFLSYADDLGLDLLQYNRDYHAKRTEARVQRDVDDGQALGLTGTPSFFVDGKPLQPESFEDLTAAIDGALEAADVR